MTQGAALVLDDLVKNYGTSVAVKGVSLDLEPGKFLTLLGASGSGKTTTLMMIAGFVEPTAGEIRINGRPVTRLPAHKRDIGMVFQNYALFPHLTVAENVGFPLRMRRIARAQAAGQVGRFLKMVGLEDFAGRYPSQLSGGQQQRVALARALVFQPSLVLMDEPLGALDRRLRLQLQEEIKGIQQRLGLTVVYVTHDQEEALTMSDSIAVMENGRISSYGAPRDIYEKPDNSFVAGFIGDSNFLACSVETSDSVRLPSGEILNVSSDGKSPGSACMIFVRPERLRLCTPQDTVPNKMPCDVLGEIYLGDSSLYRIRLQDGQELKVKRPNRGFGMTVEAGGAMHVGFDPKDARLLAA